MMVRLRIPKPRIKLPLLVIALVLVGVIGYVQPASALTKQQRELQANGIYYFDPESGTVCTVMANGDVGSLSGEDNIMKIYNYFIAKGLTPDQAYGFMGNIKQESGFQPDNQQNGYAWPEAGWGLIQWSFDRRTALAASMQQAGIGDLYNPAYADGKTPPERIDELLLFQLNYAWGELETTHKEAGDDLKAAKTLEEASTAILTKFEMPGHYDVEIPKRVALGNEVKQYVESHGGGGGGTTTPTTPSTGSGTSMGQTVVALDPGHGSTIPEYVDTVTGLVDRETDNLPEGDDVLDVSKRVKAELEKAGYKVVMLRSNSGEAVNKRARVEAALAAKANLAVSIHTTPGDMNDVWPQRMGSYRQYEDKKVSITNEPVTKKSQQYADAIASARKTAEGHDISLDTDNSHQTGSFEREDIPSKGNVSLVQLWGQDIPWVYNEIGQDAGTGISDGLKQKYTDGLVNGIKAAVPAANVPNGSSGCTSNSTGAGGLSAKTLEYAWPNYRGSDVTPKPEWQAAVTAAKAAGKYVGGIQYPGIDCGGFVTNLVIDSGFDPKYNSGGLESAGAGATATQHDWLRANWQSLGMGNTIDIATLQPGDVAIMSKPGGGIGHTFIYVGAIPGFGAVLASASLDNRAPMADTAQDAADGTFEWFRKK